jgi:hypothetical protein
MKTLIKLEGLALFGLSIFFVFTIGLCLVVVSRVIFYP